MTQNVPNRRALQLQTIDRLTLAADLVGRDGDPGLVLTHGFGQTRLAWEDSAPLLAAQGWQCLALDARGHGDSDWCPQQRYELDHFLDDLLAVCAHFEQPPVLVGASMGGLMGLLAAGEVRPLPFRALILVDVVPRWEREGVERILGFMRAHPAGFASVDEAVEAVAAYLPHRQRRHDAGSLVRYLRPTDDGRWRWHWDPSLLDGREAGPERYLPRLLQAAQGVSVPSLLVSGGLSDVVSEQGVDEFLQLVPNAEHVRIDDAAHMVVGDRNTRFVHAVADFLRRLDEPGAAGAQGGSDEHTAVSTC